MARWVFWRGVFCPAGAIGEMVGSPAPRAIIRNLPINDLFTISQLRKDNIDSDQCPVYSAFNPNKRDVLSQPERFAVAAFRKLLFAEAPLYQEHLLRLDSESRHWRFGGAVSDGAIRQYCAAIDWRAAAILGFFTGGVLRGAAEIRYEPQPMPKRAELAFTVEPACQNTRVGTTLMKRALVVLRNRGITTADIICHIQNRRMQRIALRHQSNTRSDGSDVFIAIDIPHLSPFSLLTEMLEDSQNLMAAALDYSLLVLPTIPGRRLS